MKALRMTAERMAAVLLAAGAGSRFGGGKLDAMLGDDAVGTRAWAALDSQNWAARAIVVPQQPPRFASDSGATLLPNQLAATGMASSLHVAVRFAMEKEVDALLIALADMPFITSASVAALVTAHGQDQMSATATRYPDGSMGAPSIFGSGCFGALLDINGDRGANAYLARRAVTTVPIDPAQLRDIDRPSDLS